jgi:hypothetical protein
LSKIPHRGADAGWISIIQNSKFKIQNYNAKSKIKNQNNDRILNFTLENLWLKKQLLDVCDVGMSSKCPLTPRDL